MNFDKIYSSLISPERLYSESLVNLPPEKILINTLNAYSYTLAKNNKEFRKVLAESNVLLPDGISIAWGLRFLKGIKIKKIAGADLFQYEMQRLNTTGGKCFFLGSTEEVLNKIKIKAEKEYPKIEIKSFSPAFKESFSEEDTIEMLDKINFFKPDVLFIGMTAPKQEFWASDNFNEINTQHICCIGAVFDFYAGTVKRAPEWMIKMGLEWFYRLVSEPKRMWKRYLIGNVKFVWFVFLEKMGRRN